VFNFLYWQAKRTNNQKEGLNGRCNTPGCIKVLGPRVEEESPARTVQADTSFSEKSGGEETGASSESQRLSVKKDAAPAKARGRPRKAAAQGAPACDTSLKKKSKKENRGRRKNTDCGIFGPG
jgi:hypothetical protein